MEMEGIPLRSTTLTDVSLPSQTPRGSEKLAGRAEYMVMTTKHRLVQLQHPPTTAPPSTGRDLVPLEAARAEEAADLPYLFADGLAPSADEAARQHFVAYTHGLIRELMTNYGKIEHPVVRRELAAHLPSSGNRKKWIQMVFQLQPDILVNNRNGLTGDFPGA